MKANSIVFGAALLAAASAQAQLAPAPEAEPKPALEAEAGRFGPLAAGFKRYSPLYGGNEAANPNDHVFKGFRTDPRLVLGIALNEYLSLEAGYSHLRDKGFHKIEPGAMESAAAAGALGALSHTTYLAARVTLPISERLSAYGKLGIAHSQVTNDGLLPPQRVRPVTPSAFKGESGPGAYGAVGANYRLDKRTTITGEARFNGSAAKFGNASNASGLRGSVGIGF